MELKEYEWGENYRDAVRMGIREFLAVQMRNRIDSYLEGMARMGE